MCIDQRDEIKRKYPESTVVILPLTILEFDTVRAALDHYNKLPFPTVEANEIARRHTGFRLMLGSLLESHSIDSVTQLIEKLDVLVKAQLRQIDKNNTEIAQSEGTIGGVSLEPNLMEARG